MIFNRSSFFTLVLIGVIGCHSENDSSKQGTTQESATNADQAQRKDATGKTSSSTGTVTIALEDQKRASIQVMQATVKSMPQTLTVSGQVAMDERRTNHIGALADGRVENVYALPGDNVRSGQTLATIHSHTVHETVAALTQAYADLDRQKSAVSFATQARDRYAKLYSIQAASLEETQRAEQELAQSQKNLIDAEAMVIAEREHLAEILQVSPTSLVPGTLYQRELVPIRAIADGVVITRNITPGQVVTTGDELFVTSNLSSIWVNAAVNEKDVALIHTGNSATISMQAPSTIQSSGTVTMIGSVVDPQTRTLPVRISVANPGTTLRPGMFVSASITSPGTRNAIFVSRDALQDVNGYQVVFTTQDGTHFQATTVKTGARSGDLIEIVEGLGPSDRVVTSGAFMVKGELLKGSVGEE